MALAYYVVLAYIGSTLSEAALKAHPRRRRIPVCCWP
jgi:hypothetical protein